MDWDMPMFCDADADTCGAQWGAVAGKRRAQRTINALVRRRYKLKIILHAAIHKVILAKTTPASFYM
jgi:hypothetical protein